ncbi:MAG: hypothetical protein CM15mP74_35610 [Halieaceae bacterium]|nr:MAG: hypothetical protein CM15mP74_35610 [Halieaceae bacterium]
MPDTFICAYEMSGDGHGTPASHQALHTETRRSRSPLVMKIIFATGITALVSIAIFTPG